MDAKQTIPIYDKSKNKKKESELFFNIFLYLFFNTFLHNSITFNNSRKIVRKFMFLRFMCDDIYFFRI